MVGFPLKEAFAGPLERFISREARPSHVHRAAFAHLGFSNNNCYYDYCYDDDFYYYDDYCYYYYYYCYY